MGTVAKGVDLRRSRAIALERTNREKAKDIFGVSNVG